MASMARLKPKDMKLVFAASTLGNHIGGVMFNMHVSNTVERRLEHWSGQTEDYQIGICCFPAKHEELRSKSKDGLALNQNNVSQVEWRVYLQTVV